MNITSYDRPLKPFNDYLAAIKSIVNERLQGSSESLYSMIFEFLDSVYGFDSGLIALNAELSHENGGMLTASGDKFIFQNDNKFILDYISTSNHDAIVQLILAKKTGVYRDLDNVFMNVNYFASPIYECCLDYNIGGDMLYFF